MLLAKNMPSPLLRWAGGKRRIMPTLFDALPADFDPRVHRFVDLFTGGGSVVLAVLASAAEAGRPARKGHVLAADLNSDLIATFKVVQNPALTARLVQALEKLAADTSEFGYHAVRTDFNAVRTGKADYDIVDQAARFIYLNKTNFNGLFRTNGSGEYNVPYGKKEIPLESLADEDYLNRMAAMLAPVRYANTNFTSVVSVDAVGPGDVVYADPPYVPVSSTASFSRYNATDFGVNDHYALSGLLRGYIDSGARVIMSNSTAERNSTIYRGTFPTMLNSSAYRSIASRPGARGPAGELIALSYPLDQCQNPDNLRASVVSR